MQQLKDNTIDLLFTDPPYGLGSKVIIRSDGKPDYEKATDFMNKWDMPTASFWEPWFKESMRILKYGGRIIMFGMDRQLLLPKYYASLAGFTEGQSLYWYYISSFPKSTSLSSNIDKHFGAKGEVVGENNGKGYTSQQKKNKELGFRPYKDGLPSETADRNIYAPGTELAKKYSGYRYSIAPLKQINETILVFQKPYKTGSALHDTLAYETGDKECLCGALNIDGGRVPIVNEKNPTGSAKRVFKSNQYTEEKIYGNNTETHPNGRYPSQVFVNSNTANVLDNQSGIRKSGAMKPTHNIGKTGKDGYKPYHGIYGKYKPTPFCRETESSEGGCSKILHKCDYEEGEYDIYTYCPKVNSEERSRGLEKWEDKEFKSNVPVPERKDRPFNPTKNNHPACKPLKLIERVLTLFKTPNPQIVLDPFAGTCPIPISCNKLDMQWIACEINPEYCAIGESRLKYFREGARNESKKQTKKKSNNESQCDYLPGMQ